MTPQVSDLIFELIISFYRFFGQTLLFYCIAHSPSARVRETLPNGWERWNDEMMRFMEDCSRTSPAVAQDLELLRSLWPGHE